MSTYTGNSKDRYESLKLDTVDQLIEDLEFWKWEEDCKHEHTLLEQELIEKINQEKLKTGCIKRFRRPIELERNPSWYFTIGDLQHVVVKTGFGDRVVQNLTRKRIVEPKPVFILNHVILHHKGVLLFGCGEAIGGTYEFLDQFLKPGLHILDLKQARLFLELYEDTFGPF